MWSVVNWRDLCVSDFALKWSEVCYGEVLVDKSTMHNRVTFYWGYLIVLWLFHFVCITCCGCFNSFCNVWVCVCVSFVIVWVFSELCGCFFSMCTCIYCGMCCLYWVYVLFLFVYYIIICIVCTSVNTTVTEWKLNCSK